MNALRNELSVDELAIAAGGMKWDHNYVSKDVIDARGGQVQVLFWNVTFDINGKVSSVTPR